MPTPNENQVTSALFMDRDGPLGNSEDAFGRRALHQKVGNKANEAIPMYISVPSGGTFFADAEAETDPGNDVIVLSGTLDSDTLFSKLDVSSRVESVATLKVDGQFIANLRTGAAKPNASFVWEPKRPFPAGAQYEVTIKARLESPINNCDAHLMGIKVTT